MNLSDQLAQDFTDHSIDLLRVAAGAQMGLNPMFGELQTDLTERLARSRLSASATARLAAVLRDIRALIDAQVRLMGKAMDGFLSKAMGVEGLAVANIINKAVGVRMIEGLLPQNVIRTLTNDLLIQGAPSADWWSRMAADVAFRFGVQIRTGMAQGETNEQLVARIAGIISKPRSEARSIVQTSVMTGANAARLEVYKRNEDVLAGIQQISTLDSQTTDICIAYDHACWDLDGNPIRGTTLPFDGGPPRHWGCRSVLIPLTKTWEEMGSAIPVDEMDEGTRASIDGQVAAKTDYEHWFESRTVAQQNEILGTGKAQLWREGKISMTDLLDQSGRPLTLQELKDKHD